MKDGYAATILDVVRVASHGRVELRVELQPGGGSIAGTVTQPDARAIQGVFVLVRDASGAEVAFEGVRLDGTFTAKGLRPGVHTLLVYPRNQHVQVVGGVVVRAGEPTPIAVALGEDRPR